MLVEYKKIKVLNTDRRWREGTHYFPTEKYFYN